MTNNKPKAAKCAIDDFVHDLDHYLVDAKIRAAFRDLLNSLDSLDLLPIESLEEGFKKAFKKEEER